MRQDLLPKLYDLRSTKATVWNWDTKLGSADTMFKQLNYCYFVKTNIFTAASLYTRIITLNTTVSF